VQCVVPNLKGMSTSAAKTALETARCTLGKITKKKVKKGKSDKVLTQSPAAGQAFAVGTPVSVTVTSVKKKKKKK
jgi:beta-lactam-binding protein with PASTA domain